MALGRFIFFVSILPAAFIQTLSFHFVINKSPQLSLHNLRNHHESHEAIVEHLVDTSKQSKLHPKRRQFLELIMTLTSSIISSSSPAHASTNPIRINFFSLSDMDSKKKSVNDGSELTPVKVPEIKKQELLSDGFMLGKGLEIESWMLKLLPIKNNVFQILLQDIASVSILRGRFIFRLRLSIYII